MKTLSLLGAEMVKNIWEEGSVLMTLLHWVKGHPSTQLAFLIWYKAGLSSHHAAKIKK